jgi:hypothetical protein
MGLTVDIAEGELSVCSSRRASRGCVRYTDGLDFDNLLREQVISHCGYSRRSRDRSLSEADRADTVINQHRRHRCQIATHPRIPSTSSNPLEVLATPIDWFLITRPGPRETVSVSAQRSVITNRLHNIFYRHSLPENCPEP